MTAKASLDQILERCLQEQSRMGDTEAVLRRFPELADELRPLLDVAAATRRYYALVPNAPRGLATGRERFLAEAVAGRPRGAASASGTRVLPRPAWRRLRLPSLTKLLPTVLVILLTVAVLGAGVVWAARDSLPGDLLYPVKLATEDVRLALAFRPGSKVEVLLQLVEERAEELQALAAAGREVPEQPLRRLAQHVERMLSRAAWSDDAQLPGFLAQIALRTRTQAQRLEQAQAPAQDQTRTALARAALICQQGAEIAEAGLEDPQTFRWRYRQQQGEPAPGDELEPYQERHRERQPGGTPEPLATATPAMMQPQPGKEGTPRRLQATPGPTITPHVPQATSQSETSPQAPGATITPQPTSPGPKEDSKPPHATDKSPGPGATITPQPTPQGPKRTEPPQSTPQGPGPTDGPQASPQNPGATDAPGPGPEEPAPTSGSPVSPEPPGGPCGR